MNPLPGSSSAPLPTLNKQQADLVITEATDRALSPRWGLTQGPVGSAERPRSPLPWLTLAPSMMDQVFPHTWEHRDHTLAWEAAGPDTERRQPRQRTPEAQAEPVLGSVDRTCHPQDQLSRSEESLDGQVLHPRPLLAHRVMAPSVG